MSNVNSKGFAKKWSAKLDSIVSTLQSAASEFRAADVRFSFERLSRRVHELKGASQDVLNDSSFANSYAAAQATLNEIRDVADRSLGECRAALEILEAAIVSGGEVEVRDASKDLRDALNGTLGKAAAYTEATQLLLNEVRRGYAKLNPDIKRLGGDAAALATMCPVPEVAEDEAGLTDDGILAVVTESLIAANMALNELDLDRASEFLSAISFMSDDVSLYVDVEADDVDALIAALPPRLRFLGCADGIRERKRYMTIREDFDKATDAVPSLRVLEKAVDELEALMDDDSASNESIITKATEVRSLMKGDDGTRVQLCIATARIFAEKEEEWKTLVSDALLVESREELDDLLSVGKPLVKLLRKVANGKDVDFATVNILLKDFRAMIADASKTVTGHPRLAAVAKEVETLRRNKDVKAALASARPSRAAVEDRAEDEYRRRVLEAMRALGEEAEGSYDEIETASAEDELLLETLKLAQGIAASPEDCDEYGIEWFIVNEDNDAMLETLAEELDRKNFA